MLSAALFGSWGGKSSKAVTTAYCARGFFGSSSSQPRQAAYSPSAWTAPGAGASPCLHGFFRAS